MTCNPHIVCQELRESLIIRETYKKHTNVEDIWRTSQYIADSRRTDMPDLPGLLRVASMAPVMIEGIEGTHGSHCSSMTPHICELAGSVLGAAHVTTPN